MVKAAAEAEDPEAVQVSPSDSMQALPPFEVLVQHLDEDDRALVRAHVKTAIARWQLEQLRSELRATHEEARKT